MFSYREDETTGGGRNGFYFFHEFLLVCDFILSVLVPTDVRSDNVPLFS